MWRGYTVFHWGRASAQWLNPPVASDYVSVVYFSWRDASWRQQSLADMRVLSPLTDKIDRHTLFDLLRVSWSRIRSSDISITPSCQKSKWLSCIQVSVGRFSLTTGVFPISRHVDGQSDSASLWLCAEAQTRRLTDTCAHSKHLKNFIDAFTCSLW